MIINGLKLPESFVKAINSSLFYREVGSWELKQNRDFFGNFLETELGYVYSDLDEIKKHTDEQQKYFPSEYAFEDDSEEEYKNRSEYVPYILDFSKIVEFGISGDGAPFCFDFRENLQEPSIIWWDDVYWRKIAPSFDTFIKLFNLDK